LADSQDCAEDILIVWQRNGVCNSCEENVEKLYCNNMLDSKMQLLKALDHKQYSEVRVEASECFKAD